MTALEVELFARFSAHRDGRGVAGLEAQKVQELLAYLLLHRRRPHPREALAEVLWADGASQARKYLRQTLWQLQHALEADAGVNRPSILTIENDWVSLDKRAAVRVDVFDFETAYQRVQDVPGAQLDTEAAGAIDRAVDLYAGDLLAGWYQEWLLVERERLQNLYLTMLDKLIGYAESHGKFEAGLAYCARVLSLERAHERTHRRMMRLYYLAGDRIAALRQYQRCVEALTEELGVEPSRRTRTLCEQVRSDCVALPARAAAAGISTGSPVEDASLPSVLVDLRDLALRLDDLRLRVERDAAAVETALNASD